MTLYISNAPDKLLTVSGTNGRYLVNGSSDPIVLVGFHTWYDLQDGGGTDPPPVLDWDEYLDALVSYGCNFTKLWAMETNRGWSDNTNQWYDPVRYVRTGPGNDNDGKLKVDLDQINQDYIDRIRSRAIACRTNGIYVCIQLFQGWQIETKGMAGNPVLYHPYLAANNTDAIDGDQNDDNQLTETHFDTGANVVLSYQQAMVSAIIDAVNDLDNVIYEITNEDTGSSSNTNWCNDMIDYIHTYEAGKPLQHLVMFSWQYPSGNNTNLTSGNADITSFGANDAGPLTDPFTPTGLPNMFDTDHCGGLTDTFEWLWKGLCRGNGGLWYMDEWDGALYGADRRANSTYILIRDNLGYALTLVNMLNDLLGMTSQGALSSSGWCLAKDQAANAEYVCYYNGSSTFTLNLTNAAGTLNIRWLRCSDGTVQDSATVSGGAVRTLTPPWTGAVVAYVRHI